MSDYKYNSTYLVRPTELTERERLNDFRQFYTQYDQRRSKDVGSAWSKLKEWSDIL